MEPFEVVHNQRENRFEVWVGADVAYLDYDISSETIIFSHTFVPTVLEGKGIGSALAKVGFEYAHQNGLAVVPMCSFIREYMERHPEVRNLKNDSK